MAVIRELNVLLLNLGLQLFTIHTPFRKALCLTAFRHYILAWNGLLVLGWERVATAASSPTAEVGWESPLVRQLHKGPLIARLQIETVIPEFVGSPRLTNVLTCVESGPIGAIALRDYNGSR